MCFVLLDSNFFQDENQLNATVYMPRGEIDKIEAGYWSCTHVGKTNV